MEEICICYFGHIDLQTGIVMHGVEEMENVLLDLSSPVHSTIEILWVDRVSPGAPWMVPYLQVQRMTATLRD